MSNPPGVRHAIVDPSLLVSYSARVFIGYLAEIGGGVVMVGNRITRQEEIVGLNNRFSRLTEPDAEQHVARAAEELERWRSRYRDAGLWRDVGPTDPEDEYLAETAVMCELDAYQRRAKRHRRPRAAAELRPPLRRSPSGSPGAEGDRCEPPAAVRPVTVRPRTPSGTPRTPPPAPPRSAVARPCAAAPSTRPQPALAPVQDPEVPPRLPGPLPRHHRRADGVDGGEGAELTSATVIASQFLSANS